jgi:hypothetical protein
MGQATIAARAGACLVALGLLAAGPSRAAEVCRYAGSGDYRAQIGVVTIAERHGPETELRVLWDLTARALLVFHLHYRVEEISRWRGGVLQALGLNVRAFVNGRIIRQQWDLFERGAAGFAAWRMQARREDDFAARYGAFAAHWDQASFGAPWIDAYRAAHADRRPDLDLTAAEAPPDLVPPLAEAFYRVRAAPARAQTVALFLPGNKKQRRADIAVPPPAADAAGGHLWQVPLDSEKLGIRPGSAATLSISAAGALTKIVFTVSTALHAAAGEIQAQGCAGRIETDPAVR